MTDSEIIKALECCTTKGKSCKICPAYVKVDRSNCKEAFRGALDLINRQKEEIEKLNKQLVFEIESAYDRGAKAAVKEFAERVKNCCFDLDDFPSSVVSVRRIDILAKERVGDSDG